MEKLKQNIIDNILESEVKLGRTNTSITFYYPESSLTELLECGLDELSERITDFLNNEKEYFGEIIIEELVNEKGRYGVKIPKEGLDYVYRNYRPSNFIKDFINEIKKPDNNLETIADFFRKYSSDVLIIRNNENEWGFYFTDESINPYVYHIEQNIFGLEYHRFTRAAYEKLMEE